MFSPGPFWFKERMDSCIVENLSVVTDTSAKKPGYRSMLDPSSGEVKVDEPLGFAYQSA